MWIWINIRYQVHVLIFNVVVVVVNVVDGTGSLIFDDLWRVVVIVVVEVFVVGDSSAVVEDFLAGDVFDVAFVVEVVICPIVLVSEVFPVDVVLVIEVVVVDVVFGISNGV